MGRCPHHYILLKYDIISNEIMDQVYYNFEDSDLWSQRLLVVDPKYNCDVDSRWCNVMYIISRKNGT